MIVIILKLVLLLISLCQDNFSNEGRDEQHRQVLDRIIENWKQFDKVRFRGHRILRFENRPSGLPPYQYLEEGFISDHGSFFKSTEINDSKSVTTFHLINPQYSAELQQIGDRAPSVISIEKHEPGSDLSNILKQRDLHYWENAGDQYTWRDLLSEPELEIVAISEIEWENRSAVEIKFTLGKDDEIRKTHWKVVDGLFVLLTEHHYVPVLTKIVGYRQGMNDSVLLTNEERYEFDFDSYKVPLLLKRTIDFKRRDHGEYATYEFTYDISAPMKAAKFTVSQFGIPEPDWYRPPPPYWLYASIIGMI
ncbi:MAG TPA: hypothetical protein PKD64_12815, partial [Pirellulaceae bacterium]|nr:hypothetical protein [Pirellulaceae bacterium]HMO93069.1 hypothetical protein [Pirellulaceae bacterium]HMP69980.1 hypothetical protein [Pirellulaceae bacterium]